MWSVKSNRVFARESFRFADATFGLLCKEGDCSPLPDTAMTTAIQMATNPTLSKLRLIPHPPAGTRLPFSEFLSECMNSPGRRPRANRMCNARNCVQQSLDASCCLCQHSCNQEVVS